MFRAANSFATLKLAQTRHECQIWLGMKKKTRGRKADDIDGLLPGRLDTYIVVRQFGTIAARRLESRITLDHVPDPDRAFQLKIEAFLSLDLVI